MSVYIPLATKYRPQKFSDVVGQDMVVRIITRGLMKNRLGPALLFSGARGIGKTTIARILAKAWRCENRTDADPEPCCQCMSCRNFLQGNQIDVVEIDAASNTGVDDVREIIESSRYAPTFGKFKIFIVDEVHMLSKSAFNALLKTLEEPPAHVKFLFATTETYKIPETVMSRVLKFDLKKVDMELMIQYLSSICNQEEILANADVLTMIARAADGSIRDGLSVLDQAINVAEGNALSSADLKSMLNVSDDNDTMELLELIFSPNIESTIKKYREIITNNVSAVKVINALVDNVHVLTCLKTHVTPLEMIVSDGLFPRLEKLAKAVSLAAVSRIWQMLLKGIHELKFSDRPEIILEMLLIRITYAAELPDLRELVDEIVKKQRRPLAINEKMSHTESAMESLTQEAFKMFPGAKLEQ
ncbi:MAG: DNA polymerase III subunit gamma/tau [Holosporaceae bacterium]|nr:DNA polymerase III subunit gamma/tau [Holosporaceae bacterium]